MVTLATFIAVLVDIAIGARAWRRIATHEKADLMAHRGFDGRLKALEGPSLVVAGFTPAVAQQKSDVVRSNR